MRYPRCREPTDKIVVVFEKIRNSLGDLSILSQQEVFRGKKTGAGFGCPAERTFKSRTLSAAGYLHDEFGCIDQAILGGGQPSDLLVMYSPNSLDSPPAPLYIVAVGDTRIGSHQFQVCL